VAEVAGSVVSRPEIKIEKPGGTSSSAAGSVVNKPKIENAAGSSSRSVEGNRRSVEENRRSVDEYPRSKAKNPLDERKIIELTVKEARQLAELDSKLARYQLPKFWKCATCKGRVQRAASKALTVLELNVHVEGKKHRQAVEGQDKSWQHGCHTCKVAPHKFASKKDYVQHTRGAEHCKNVRLARFQPSSN